MQKDIFDAASQKKVLFISTKNIDYIRNVQEIKLLEKASASLDIIASGRKNYLLRVLYVYISILRKCTSSYDIIFVGFAPQLVCLLLPYLKKRCVLFAVDFFISLYDTIVCDRKIVSNTNIIARLIHKMDKYTLQSADKVIADTLAHAQYFSSEFDCPIDKIEVIYLEADHDVFFPRAAEEKKESFTVLYFGSVLPLQGVEHVLEAMKLLKDDMGIRFIFVGPIKHKQGFTVNDYPNTIFYDWLSTSELANQIASSDLCLAGHFNKEIDKAKRTIPGKAYIYQAMEKPLVLGDNAATRERFVEEHPYYFVEMGNSGALANLIRECRNKFKSHYGE